MLCCALQGKDYGPHGFVVQIRDMDSHRPLRGIAIGDIGPKAGYNGVDNGFMSFDHVRVPRAAMLMRFSQVRYAASHRTAPQAACRWPRLMHASCVQSCWCAGRHAASSNVKHCEPQALDCYITFWHAMP